MSSHPRARAAMALTLAASMRRELLSPHFSRNTKLLAHRAFIAAARRHRATWWLV
jgi:hypothetical protein